MLIGYLLLDITHEGMDKLEELLYAEDFFYEKAYEDEFLIDISDCEYFESILEEMNLDYAILRPY